MTTESPIPRESLHRISDWEREQADTPLYTPFALVGWFLLWAVTIVVACGSAAWLGMALLQWLEPHWPALVSMVTP